MPHADPVGRRAARALVSLHRSGMLAPVAGMAAVGASVAVMQATAVVFPETAALAGEAGICNPLRGDFGCGHGFGCACPLLPGG